MTRLLTALFVLFTRLNERRVQRAIRQRYDARRARAEGLFRAGKAYVRITRRRVTAGPMARLEYWTPASLVRVSPSGEHVVVLCSDGTKACVPASGRFVCSHPVMPLD